jgi:hypothetical protein
MHLPHLTSVWRRWIEEESGRRNRVTTAATEEACGRGSAAAKAEEACVHGRAVAAAEEASSSGVDGSGGDRRSRERAAGTQRVLG